MPLERGVWQMGRIHSMTVTRPSAYVFNPDWTVEEFVRYNTMINRGPDGIIMMLMPPRVVETPGVSA
jgi:hypothetical protein